MKMRCSAAAAAAELEQHGAARGRRQQKGENEKDPRVGLFIRPDS